MILEESYSPEWIRAIQRKSRKDPGLIEKVILALTLLEQLQLSGLNFIFKGGTALILLLGKPERLSIDIDILVHPDQRDSLPEAVQSVFARGIFISVEEKVRFTSKTIPKTHYKLYYRSVVSVKSKFVCKIPVEKVWSYMSRITLLVGAPLDVRQAWYSSIQR